MGKEKEDGGIRPLKKEDGGTCQASQGGVRLPTTRTAFSSPASNKCIMSIIMTTPPCSRGLHLTPRARAMESKKLGRCVGEGFAM